MSGVYILSCIYFVEGCCIYFVDEWCIYFVDEWCIYCRVVWMGGWVVIYFVDGWCVLNTLKTVVWCFEERNWQ